VGMLWACESCPSLPEPPSPREAPPRAVCVVLAFELEAEPMQFAKAGQLRAGLIGQSMPLFGQQVIHHHQSAGAFRGDPLAGWPLLPALRRDGKGLPAER